MLLASFMLFEAGETGIVYAAGEIDKAVNPAEQTELTVPDKYQDGGNWFFMVQPDWIVSEKSDETLYIPIHIDNKLTNGGKYAIM